MPTWRVYRASLILFLVRREFGPEYTRTDATADDAARISRAIARVRRNNNK
jgi:hypothetical protein